MIIIHQETGLLKTLRKHPRGGSWHAFPQGQFQQMILCRLWREKSGHSQNLYPRAAAR